MALKSDLRSSNDKKFTGHTDNKKLALAPGLLGARKLYKIGKTKNAKLEMNPNEKIKQGDLGSESGSVGKKEKVDASIFKKAEVRDY